MGCVASGSVPFSRGITGCVTEGNVVQVKEQCLGVWRVPPRVLVIKCEVLDGHAPTAAEAVLIRPQMIEQFPFELSCGLCVLHSQLLGGAFI